MPPARAGSTGRRKATPKAAPKPKKPVAVPRTAAEKMAADATAQSYAAATASGNARLRTVTRGALPERRLRAGGLELLRYSQGAYRDDPGLRMPLPPGVLPPPGVGGSPANTNLPRGARRDRPTGEQQPNRRRDRDKGRDTPEAPARGPDKIKQRNQKRRQEERRRKAEAERRRREREKKKAPRGPGPVAS